MSPLKGPEKKNVQSNGVHHHEACSYDEVPYASKLPARGGMHEGDIKWDRVVSDLKQRSRH